MGNAVIQLTFGGTMHVVDELKGLFLSNDLHGIINRPTPSGVLSWSLVLGNFSISNMETAPKKPFDFIFYVMSDATWSWPKKIKERYPDSKVLGLADVNIKSFGEFEVFEKNPSIIYNLNHNDGVVVSSRAHFDFFHYVLDIPVYYLQHPVDISSISTHRSDTKNSFVGVFIHRYNKYTKTIWSLLPRNTKVFGIKKDIYYYRYQEAYRGVSSITVPQEYYDQVATLHAMINTQTWDTMDRVSIENAVLGIPTITQRSCSSSADILFPDLIVDDIYNLAEISDKLLLIDSDRDKLVEYAQEHVYRFGLEQARENFHRFWGQVNV